MVSYKLQMDEAMMKSIVKPKTTLTNVDWSNDEKHCKAKNYPS